MKFNLDVLVATVNAPSLAEGSLVVIDEGMRFSYAGFGLNGKPVYRVVGGETGAQTRFRYLAMRNIVGVES